MKKRPPFYGLDPKQIAKLKSLGAKRTSDYYKLTYKQQISLQPELRLGGVALDPADPEYRCTELELPENPEPGIVTPVVDWTWRSPFPGEEHIIDTRPWWGEPDLEVGETSAKYEEQTYWYPDPAQGWKVFGYQFGHTGGQLGYLLMYNNYTGVMRLFVYLPGVEQHNFNNLLCKISITDGSYQASDLWHFPAQDLPPTIQQFEANAAGSGGPQENFSEIPNSLLVSWPGKDEPYHTLSAAVSGAFGVWLRTEIPTLYDARLYPSTQPLRALGGCLSIFFGGRNSGTAIRDDDRRMLHLKFYTANEGQTELEANLQLDLSGKATPVATSESIIGVLINTALGAKGGVSGAVEALEFLKISATGGGGIAAIAAAGLAGGFYALIDNGDQPPEYQVKMLGVATGTVSGKTIFVQEATTFNLNLSDTFIARIDADGNYMPVGFPQNYQRCEQVRFGLFGFRPHGTDAAYITPDPRPDSIIIDWFPDQSGDFNIPYIIVNPVGYFQTAPWAQIDIVSQKAQLELLDQSGSIPYAQQIVLPLTLEEDTSTGILSRDTVVKIIAAMNNQNKKLLIRWFATIQPRDPNVSSFTVQYALDVSNLPTIKDEPGTGSDEWPD